MSTFKKFLVQHKINIKTVIMSHEQNVTILINSFLFSFLMRFFFSFTSSELKELRRKV